MPEFSRDPTDDSRCRIDQPPFTSDCPENGNEDIRPERNTMGGFSPLANLLAARTPCFRPDFRYVNAGASRRKSDDKSEISSFLFPEPLRSFVRHRVTCRNTLPRFFLLDRRHRWQSIQPVYSSNQHASPVRLPRRNWPSSTRVTHFSRIEGNVALPGRQVSNEELARPPSPSSPV